MSTATGVYLQTNDSMEVVYNVSNSTMLATDGTGGVEVCGYKVAEKMLYTYVLPVLCCFGILGNMLNLAILHIHIERLEKCTHSPLIARAVSDLMFCIVTLPRSTKPKFVHASHIKVWLLYDTYYEAAMKTRLESISAL